MYKIKTDIKNELFLCVIYRSLTSRDDNNEQLLDLIVELCDKRMDKLLFIGYCIGTDTVFPLDNGKSQSATPARRHAACSRVPKWRVRVQVRVLNHQVRVTNSRVRVQVIKKRDSSRTRVRVPSPSPESEYYNSANYKSNAVVSTSKSVAIKTVYNNIRITIAVSVPLFIGC